MSPVANLGYHVSLRRKCASGAPNRASAVRHTAFWEVGLSSDGSGVHQDLEKLGFLALSDLVGRWNKLRKRWCALVSDAREGGRLRQTGDPAYNPDKQTTPSVYLWAEGTVMKCRNEPSDGRAVRTTIPSPDRVKKEGRCEMGTR